jgi:hypothetical protein
VESRQSLNSTLPAEMKMTNAIARDICSLIGENLKRFHGRSRGAADIGLHGIRSDTLTGSNMHIARGAILLRWSRTDSSSRELSIVVSDVVMPTCMGNA